MMTVLCVAAAGAVGAPTRYLADAFVQERAPGAFPRGTLLIK
jgi:fluoride ion exporter CrcB/FEX